MLNCNWIGFILYLFGLLVVCVCSFCLCFAVLFCSTGECLFVWVCLLFELICSLMGIACGVIAWLDIGGVLVLLGVRVLVSDRRAKLCLGVWCLNCFGIVVGDCGWVINFVCCVYFVFFCLIECCGFLWVFRLGWGMGLRFGLIALFCICKFVVTLRGVWLLWCLI